MSKLCIFCAIVQDKAPASRVYHDEHVMAFMDNNPITPGHLLVIPKKHAQSLSDLPQSTGGHIFRVGMRLAAALRQSRVRCEGINFLLADGREAGQQVFHVHLHVVPRYAGDGFGFRRSLQLEGTASRDELERVAADIRHVLER